jgi:hypothetical protein
VQDSTDRPTSTDRPRRPWALFLIAAPAAVAVWSGWVGLGALCGFGPVNLLPGFGDGFHINTAITLPVGVEAYGAYALGVWLAAVNAPWRARRFARKSAIGALALGMLGQIAYHLLAAAHRTRAPWPVVVLVSCIPVVVLGFGAALTHLMRTARPALVPAAAAVPEPYPAEPDRPAPDAELDRLIAWLTRSGNAVPDVPEQHRGAAVLFADELARGELPGIRAIRRELRVGQDRAYEVQAYLRTLVPDTAEKIRAELKTERTHA